MREAALAEKAPAFLPTGLPRGEGAFARCPTDGLFVETADLTLMVVTITPSLQPAQYGVCVSLPPTAPPLRPRAAVARSYPFFIRLPNWPENANASLNAWNPLNNPQPSPAPTFREARPQRQPDEQHLILYWKPLTGVQFSEPQFQITHRKRQAERVAFKGRVISSKRLAPGLGLWGLIYFERQ